MIDQKSHWAAIVFASLAMMVLVTLNLPYVYTDLEGAWSAPAITNSTWTGSINTRHVCRAGFPITYNLSMVNSLAEDGNDREAIFNFTGPISIPKLIFNAVVVVFVIVFTYAATLYRYRLKTGLRADQIKGRVLDLTLGVGSLAVLVLYATLLYRETAKHRYLAASTVNTTNCFLTCQVPIVIQGKTPDVAKLFFTRIRVAELYRPTNETLDNFTALKSLTGLRILGGQPRYSHFAKLRHNPLFTSLHIDSVKLEERDYIQIGAISQLNMLNLTHTNLDRIYVRHLDKLSQLTFVDFVNTRLRLQDLGSPVWRESVIDLRLPRDVELQSDCLQLDGWSKLARLAVTDTSVALSPNAIRLELTNLPMLRTLTIDRNQKYELIAKNVPRLSEIVENTEQLLMLSQMNAKIPRQTWFSRIEIENAASFSALGCFARDIKSIKVSNCPSLRHLTVANGDLDLFSTMSEIANSVLDAQRIFDSLAQCDGPQRIEFEQLDLRQVSFSQISKNKGIRDLRFINCQLNFDQIRELKGLSELKTLLAAWCEANTSDLDWLLQTFPALSDFEFDIGEVEELSLNHRPLLRSVRTRPLKNVRCVSLKSVPNLDAQIHVCSEIDRLQVTDAPQLSGLGLEGPWPKNAEISGLRELKWFAAGGAQVNDDVLSEILYCQSLDRLMLAYPTISKDLLGNIGGFFELTSLVLPGTPIDDSVTEKFRELRLLREVNFDDTQIGLNTLDWLREIECLRRLSISRVKLPGHSAKILLKFTQLNELEVANVQIPEDVLIEILQNSSLEHLNYADHELSPTIFDSFVANQTLRLINVNGCGVTLDQAAQLLRSKPGLYLYAGDELQQQLTTDPLVEDVHDRILTEYRYHQTHRLLANYSVPHSSTFRTRYYFTNDERATDEMLFGWFEPSRFRR